MVGVRNFPGITRRDADDRSGSRAFVFDLPLATSRSPDFEFSTKDLLGLFHCSRIEKRAGPRPRPTSELPSRPKCTQHNNTLTDWVTERGPGDGGRPSRVR